MRRREVERALATQGRTLLRERGGHDVDRGPCGEHSFPLPRHRTISPGVVRNAMACVPCLPEGWLR
jgi:predicted RNA binding protein YcfA (HicA-like mRNA interferase family)